MKFSFELCALHGHSRIGPWVVRSCILYEGESLIKAGLTESLSDGGQRKGFHTGPIMCVNISGYVLQISIIYVLFE